MMLSGPRTIYLAVLAALVVMMLLPVSVYASVSPSELPAMSQHGPDHTHLDCSSCLIVAYVLGARMNVSLKESGASFLVSHRLDSTNQLKRMEYRNSELRTVEVMENACDETRYTDFPMRLNPQTKVRGFHFRTRGEAKSGRRSTFLEGIEYMPEGKKDGNFAAAAAAAPAASSGDDDGLMAPVARHYTRAEREGFALHAPQSLCSFLLGEHDEDVEEIVRNADWLSEVEENLCGLDYSGGGRNKRAQGIGQWKGLEKPVFPVCQPSSEILRSAALDQARWTHWTARKQVSKERKSAVRTATPAVEDDDDGGDL